MIRVRLTEPDHRDAIAEFLGFANLAVTSEPSSDDTLYVGFHAFDLDENAQLRIVTRMIDAWHTERLHAAYPNAEITIQR